MQTVKIVQYDDRLLIKPMSECFRKALTLFERSLEGARSVAAYAEQDGVGITYPGFAGMLAEVAMRNNILPDVQDRRKCRISAGFPAPKLDAMYGFRFSQESLITEALKKDCSGLIGAPTRYGKTTLMVNTLRAFPDLPAVVVAPGVDLVNQLYEDLTGERGVKGREIRRITGQTSRKDPSDEGITVCTIDGLKYIDEDHPRLLLADEPHSLVTDTRLSLLNKFTRARRYGYGATLTGRFDGRDRLITGAFGPVLSNKTYKEAVAEGAICQLHVIFLRVELTPTNAWSRNQAYSAALFLNPAMANTVATICKNVVPAEWQTLVFIADENQAELYLSFMEDGTALAMAKRMGPKQRKELVEHMRANNIKRCLCTNIFVQGVTFSDLLVLINCNAGSKYTSTIQKPGRLAEIRPGKKCGIVIDFMFDIPDDLDCNGGDAWTMPYFDSLNRKKVYEKMGYGVHEVNSMQELKSVFDMLTAGQQITA